jgi:hypothetical protein
MRNKKIQDTQMSDKQLKLWAREYFSVRGYTITERPNTHPDFLELVTLLRVVYNEGRYSVVGFAEV